MTIKCYLVLVPDSEGETESQAPKQVAKKIHAVIFDTPKTTLDEVQNTPPFY